MPDSNLFSDLNPDNAEDSEAAAPPPQVLGAAAPASQVNIFDDLNPDLQPDVLTSSTGSFARSAERSLLPAAGGLAGAGAGAEAGAAVGSFAGPVGTLAGGFIGGVAGMFGGQALVDKVQNWALSELPDSWREALGQDDRQQTLDQEYHPTASFLGGLAPYALTLKPSFSLAARALPENATAWQRILANPVTSRLFAGAGMGGMQVAQELAAGQTPDWRNDAIATGFGVIFNRPTGLGEALSEVGARPVRRALGTEPVAPAAAPAAPTVAAAGDAKVMGPGVTEDVFMGAHQQAPEAEMTAQDAARTETSLSTTPVPPSVGDVARRMEPDTFSEYDALSAQRDDLRAHLAALASPGDEVVADATAQRDALQARLAEHVTSRNGYAGGPEARALRAQLRDAQNQIDEMEARRAGTAAGDTPAMAQLRSQIMSTDVAMRDMAPRVSAAYRRAADASGSEALPPEVPPVQAPLPVAAVPEAAPAVPAGPSVEEQVAAIAQNVTAQLTAAGRPPEEARAAGSLIAQRYKTRAARMHNAIGGPQALYESEGPDIRRGGRVAPAPAAARAGAAIDPAAAKASADAQGVTNLVSKMIGAGASDEEISTLIGKKLSPEQVASLRGAELIKRDDEISPESKVSELAQDKVNRLGPDVSRYQSAIKDEASKIASQAGMPRDFIDGVYLVGSRASGVAKDGSDYDFVIRFRGDANDRAVNDAWGTLVEHFQNDANRTIDVDGVRHRADFFVTDELESGRPAIGVTLDQAAVPSRNIDTPEFKEWFGESRVVDGQGAPKRMYRGDYRADKLDVMKPQTEGEGGSGGVYFTDDPSVASGYATSKPYMEGNYDEVLDNTKVTIGGREVPLLTAGGRLTATQKAKIEKAVLSVGERPDGPNGVGSPDPSIGKSTWQDYLRRSQGDYIKAADEVLLKSGSLDRDEFVQFLNDTGVFGNVDFEPPDMPRHGVTPVYLSIKKPLDLTAITPKDVAKLSKLVPDDDLSLYVVRENAAGRPETMTTITDAMRAALEKLGYDGVHDVGGRNTGGEAHDVWIALDPTQIKSVANRGTFDPNDPRILMQGKRGSITLREGRRPIIKLFADADASTFIHETGHQWLEELIRDAAHPAAGDDVRGDADTVRKWLGMRGSEPPPPAEGTIRYYHGTTAKTAEGFSGKTFVSPHYAYARDYRGGPNNVLYTDLSREEAIQRHLYDDINNFPINGAIDDGAARLKPTTADASITTRQHEKFARGFEQYMREGVAPSKGLARVFAQFKGWLTAIYQTIKGLGAPISNDIRGVFDRMLATEPDRTVVAPERDAQPSLAAIHETDAAEAHPSEADAVGDRIAAERDRYMAEQPPEVLNEIRSAEAEHAAATAEPSGEGGAGPSGQREVGGGGVQPQPVAEGGGSSGERGPVVGSGGAGVGEGAGLPGGSGAGSGGTAADSGLRSQRPVTAGASGPQSLAPSAGDRFDARESPFVDKAGNIRIDNLTSDQDVAQAIRDAAKDNDDFIGDRRGVITDGQVLDLADALGTDAATLQKRKLGQAFNAEQIVAARKLLIQSATEMSALMKRAAVGTDEDVLAYARGKARHQMIQGQVAGLTAEAGRALRAFRSLAGQSETTGVDQFLRDATGKTLFQLKAEAKLGAALETPQDVSKFVNDARKRGFWDMVLEYWINGLISGPTTHVTYAIGNTVLAIHKAGPETAAAALIGAVRRRAGRAGEVVHLGEVREQLKAGVASLPSALKAAADAFRTGVTTRLPGETAKSLPFQPGTEFAPSATTDESFGYHDVMPGVFGAVRGIRDGILSAGRLVDAGEGAVGLRYSALGAIPDITVRGVPVIPVGTLARLPSRFIASIHSFFRAMNYSMAKNAIAYRTAMEEGLSGTAFDARVADVRQNPSEEVMDQSRSTATTATLMGQGGEFMRAVSQLTNKRLPILNLPILKFIDPFVQIAGNIVDQAILQRTPVGLLSAELRADLSGKNGNVAQDTAMARMLVGTGMAVAFGSLAAEGLVSGSGPSDRNQAAMWRLAGNQAHSIRIGDTWYQMNRLGPLGMLASVSADMYDVAHALGEGDLSAVGAALMHGFTQNVLDESFMRGPAELIQAVEDPGRYGQSYIRNFISSFVPYSVGLAQIARSSDPYSRQARTVMDAVRKGIPGLSETLLPRRDIWGEEMPNLRGLGTFTAIYAQQAGSDPVNQAMLSLGVSPAQPERKIRGVQLTDPEYDDYSRLAGRMAKQRLDVIVRSPDWQTWTPETRHDVLKEAIRQARETARGMVMAKNPDIIRQAVAAKLAPLAGTN